jgi:putative endonuclease
VHPKRFCVYIMSNFSGTLYIGVTSDLRQRVYRHKRRVFPGAFTAQYNITKLVYWEPQPNAWAAIRREKQLKGWNRKRKVALIASRNPDWADLAANWFR